MAIPIYKLIDKAVGIPLCWMIGTVSKISGKPKIPESPRRIILVKLWAMGDSIVMMPLIKALRDKYPSAEIDVLCRRRNREVFDCTPYLSSIQLFEPDWRSLSCLIRNIRHYDIVIDCEPYLRLSALLSFWLGGIRIGWDGFARSKLYNFPVKFDRTKHMVQNYISLGEPLGAVYRYKTLVKPVVLQSDKDHAMMALESRGIRAKDTVVGACPSVAESSKSRQWMPERFAEALDKIAHQHKAKIIFFGGRGDIEAINAVKDLMKEETAVLAGQLTLPQTFAALDRCNLVISVDTGPMHAAAAMGTPTLGLFGPNIPTLWAPYGPDNASLYHSIDCSPCIINEKGVMPQCKCKDELHKCMKMITVEEVVKAANKVLR
ncbi:MAG: glycosyltransferase family 9 protein [Nanoarchaeota archaeon]